MNITWIGANSSNYTQGRDRPVDKIVVHWIVGTLEAADATFQDGRRKASAHYGVGGEDIHQYVKEEDTAWHAKDWDANSSSIGIEHEGGPDLPISDKTYETSSLLIRDICRRYDIPIDDNHIFPHNKYAATTCPGTLDIHRLIVGALDGPSTVDWEALAIKYKEERDRKDEKLEDCRDDFAKAELTASQTIEKQQKLISTANEQLTLATKRISDLEEENKRLRDESGASGDEFKEELEEKNKEIERQESLLETKDKTIEKQIGIIDELRSKLKQQKTEVNEVSKKALFEALKELGRLVLFSLPGLIVSVLSELPATEVVTVSILVFRGLDKFLHVRAKEDAEVKLSGLSPF